ncbi:MAG: glycerophosphodiester phosphodiesterase family protein [Flavobacteriaceae bacterium]|nr:glycerophosphodiester phosphodiesterase family protein [Bacteroidia bacterium]NNL60034.1 glycerophosphodiester phosphodiesterase family protein [Flavobacteriaceae bacterium]
MKKLLLIFLLITGFTCKEHKQNKNSSTLLESFKYSKGADPIISVHRGGKGIAGYPENCLETIKYIHERIPAIYEVDIAQTKDKVLVLMHDNTLERTTTGQGKINQYNYTELLQFNLVDDFGTPTVFQIPRFEDVLNWAKDNDVVLTIDIKRSVKVKDVIDIIQKNNAQDVSIIITYDLKQAQKAYKLAPELILSVSARNEQELDWLIHSSIPIENMVAFTGTRLSSPELYKKVHSYGMKCILGALGNLDKRAQARGDHLYQEWISQGIDIIATDRPLAVAESLNLKKEE